MFCVVAELIIGVEAHIVYENICAGIAVSLTALPQLPPTMRFRMMSHRTSGFTKVTYKFCIILKQLWSKLWSIMICDAQQYAFKSKTNFAKS